ncbi:MAG TPA: hypothetical protein VE684_14045 [Crenalkalicoccus sp.]|nr:hypothetical protein [Crenalkalicoccus sp.]
MDEQAGSGAGVAELQAVRTAPPQAAGSLADCDVVFRGGITSGVIYPGTIAALAERYRFRSVGGASAGAIAAGVTAAAEHGRQSRNNPDAFAEVAGIAQQVGGQTTSLRTLFRPGPGWGLWLLDQAFWAALRFGLKELAIATVMAGLLIGLLVAWLIGGGWGSLLFFLLLVPVALAVGLGTLVFTALPRAGFGLCPGINPKVTQDAAAMQRDGALMDWLHVTVQRAAGRSVGRVTASAPQGGKAIPPSERPLTMGDLWGEGPAREVDLVLTTTNLSQGLSHRFPFLEREDGSLYFHPEELAQVLPRDVVRWMVLTAREPDPRVADQARARGLCRLPAPHDLPVLLGVRLSLSFPGLIAAVRLHAQGADARGGATALAPCWFSDGGITSNFPINAFDAPLPRWPTFCIDLREAEQVSQQDLPDLKTRMEVARDRAAAAAAERGRNPAPWRDARAASPAPAATAPGASPDPLVVMPMDVDDDQGPRFRARVDGSLPAFLGAIVSTARNAAENELMLLPGYRDRVVHVLTRAGEGGLNLAMPPATIATLSARGRTAGELLVSRFHPEGAAARAGFGLGWPNQRWVRYRSTMAGTERFLADFALAWRAPAPGALPFEEALAQSGQAWPDPETAAAAREQTGKVLELADGMRAAAASLPPREPPVLPGVFDDGTEATGAPRPKLGVQLRPVGEDPEALRTYDPAALSGARSSAAVG